MLLLHAASAADAPAGAGIAGLAARTPVIVAKSLPPADPAAAGKAVLACTGTLEDRCFETGTTRLINVGAFFDRRRQSASSHFFLKYFEPPAGATYRIEGFTFTSNRSGIAFPGCGVVRTSRENPTFPSADDLSRLQQLFVPSAGANVPTCVDLAGSNFQLEDGQAAWIVLQFPDPPDTSFVGVAADPNGTDHPCDFLTRDRGDFWFRPDPRQNALDWAITVHYAPPVAKQERRIPWSAMKNLHR